VLPETDMEYFGSDGDRMHMMQIPQAASFCCGCLTKACGA
jgi:hypothetical protein